MSSSSKIITQRPTPRDDRRLAAVFGTSILVIADMRSGDPEPIDTNIVSEIEAQQLTLRAGSVNQQRKGRVFLNEYVGLIA
jgi:hypothetical protein